MPCAGRLRFAEVKEILAEEKAEQGATARLKTAEHD